MKVARLRKAARLSSPKSYGASANSDACINYRSLSLAKPVGAEQIYGFRIRLSDWGKIAVGPGRKFVCQVLLSLSKIELVNQDKFAAAASFKLADQQRV